MGVILESHDSLGKWDVEFTCKVKGQCLNSVLVGGEGLGFRVVDVDFLRFLRG